MHRADEDDVKMSGPGLAVRTVLLVVAMLCFGLKSPNAWPAGPGPSDYRVAAASDKFDDSWQLAAAFRIQPPRRLRANHLELAVGSISNSQDNSGFVSVGPVWRFPLSDAAMFIDLGVSPTLIIGSSSFNGRNLGGNFHFTSSLAIGVDFGQSHEASVSLRVQHTSNAGLSSTNPGLDMIGINLAFRPTNQ